MKCLQLFKNRTGAISGVRAGVLALMVASVGFSISSYFGGGETTSQSPQVRNLAAIMSQGGQLPVQYASIATSFTKGNLQFATAKEKAEMEGTALGQTGILRCGGTNFRRRRGRIGFPQ